MITSQHSSHSPSPPSMWPWPRVGNSELMTEEEFIKLVPMDKAPQPVKLALYGWESRRFNKISVRDADFSAEAAFTPLEVRIMYWASIIAMCDGQDPESVHRVITEIYTKVISTACQRSGLDRVFVAFSSKCADEVRTMLRDALCQRFKMSKNAAESLAEWQHIDYGTQIYKAWSCNGRAIPIPVLKVIHGNESPMDLTITEPATVEQAHIIASKLKLQPHDSQIQKPFVRFDRRAMVRWAAGSSDLNLPGLASRAATESLAGSSIHSRPVTPQDGARTHSETLGSAGQQSASTRRPARQSSVEPLPACYTPERPGTPGPATLQPINGFAGGTLPASSKTVLSANFAATGTDRRPSPTPSAGMQPQTRQYPATAAAASQLPTTSFVPGRRSASRPSAGRQQINHDSEILTSRAAVTEAASTQPSDPSFTPPAIRNRPRSPQRAGLQPGGNLPSTQQNRPNTTSAVTSTSSAQSNTPALNPRRRDRIFNIFHRKPNH